MATSAVAQATVFALRQKIARIEGTLPERLAAPAKARPEEGAVVLRRNGAVDAAGCLATGAAGFDAALGGGLPLAALTEIHGTETRDAGSASGFALALAGLLLARAARRVPLLWIGTTEIFREAGMPYAPGLRSRFGIEPDELLIAEAPNLLDALWIAEEAADLKGFSAVILEIRGNPQKLDLTATRRLHRRALGAGRPVFLLRQAGQAEPTAAPVRLVVSPATAAPRHTLAGPLAGSIGPPGFAVSIDKSRLALPGQFTLEWNADERSFAERHKQALGPADTGAVVSLSRHRAHPAPASGTVLAFAAAGAAAAAGHQPSRKERAAHRSPRRTG
ncbi:ImuA family protein [Pseudaminobacter soli (ex Li et al. 2025)]|uniref:ImuA family protein n=1 Tax=Pseudaminobacter soli (ex Li et al. 2025) TaxID=1295366 RepID=UPI001FE06DD9|nr:hypothetical protein [Mesorhizobium soli]